jgi:uncharacterized protein YggE
MATEKPNTLKIHETRRHKIPADRADLHVKVEGTSLFTGNEALHKAREVAQLVRELAEYGLPSENIYLQGIHADKYTGTLSRTSHVRYSLRVHCADLQTLADLLGIITSQKNVTLHFIEWGYPEEATREEEWLQECITQANQKAARIASSLGVRLLGVYTFSEKYMDDQRIPSGVAEDEMAFSRRTLTMARVSSEELGLEISHTKTVHVSVEVEYLVSTYEPAPQL